MQFLTIFLICLNVQFAPALNFNRVPSFLLDINCLSENSMPQLCAHEGNVLFPPVANLKYSKMIETEIDMVNNICLNARAITLKETKSHRKEHGFFVCFALDASA